LLKSCDIEFETAEHRFDEESINLKNPVELAKTLAYKKAESVSVLPEYDGKYILAVDTIVSYKNRILGKPKNAGEAEKNIRMLSGHSHNVISGISIINSQKDVFLTEYCVSKVFFSKINEDFIKFYLDNNHWEGYAGGYAIQGIFSLVTRKIKGSYSNIVGLPMEVLYKMLNKLNLFP
jgi:septum formation protein